MINTKTVQLLLAIAAATVIVFSAAGSPCDGSIRSSVPGLYTAGELNELFRQWAVADGEAISIVSDRFAFFLIGNPGQFYAGMAQHPDAFEKWLRRLAGTTFTDYGGGCINRECLRAAMIHAVEKNDLAGERLSAVRTRLLKALKETEISKVD